MSSRRRSLVLATGLIAAAAFALSVQLSPWWAIGEVSIGPNGAHHCFGGECRASGLGWIGGSDLWMRSAIATYVAGLVAMFLGVMLAGAVAAKRVPRLVAKTLLVATATAAVTGGYFVGAFPGVGGAGIDRGVVLFAIAIVAGIVAAIAVMRAPK